MKKERSVGNAVYSLALMALLTGGMLGLLAGCPTAGGGGGGGGDECQVDADCDDDLFCNGDEACVDGKCESLGSPCEAGEECDEEANECVTPAPAGFQNADAARGGQLYDKWWNVADVTAAEPTDDHARYPAVGEKTGSTTWRCKECHGWDYKGAAGAYGSGSHFTDIVGIFGTTRTEQEVFDSIKDGHGFGAAGLSDEDIWDLARFVLEGAQLDTDALIDGDGAFTGDVAAGEQLYSDNIDTNTACTICHGADGRTIDFGGEFIGELATRNPWEFQHKVFYGHPGSGMPVGIEVDITAQELADLGTYSATLAEAP